MKDNFKLVGITVLFLLTGLLLSFFALQESDLVTGHYCEVDGTKYTVGEEIAGYEKGKICACSTSGIVECIPNEVVKLEEEDISFEISGLEIEGLEFESHYLTGLTNGDSSLMVDPIRFKNINVLDGDLTVVLEQMQLCPEQNILSEQVGFYNYSDNVLKLYNMVKSTSSVDSVSCMVQLKYTFGEFENLGELQIAFVDESGLLTYASMCLSDGKIYSDEDVFRNPEGLICNCNDGEIECEESSD